MTTAWSGAPAAAARRAAFATSLLSGIIWKFKVFMSTAKCIASIRASTKFGQRIPRAISGRQPGKLPRRRVLLPQPSPSARWGGVPTRRSIWRERLGVCSVDGERRHHLSSRCRPGRFCRRHAKWWEHRRESFVHLFCCQQATSQAGDGTRAIIHLWSEAGPSHHALQRAWLCRVRPLGWRCSSPVPCDRVAWSHRQARAENSLDPTDRRLSAAEDCRPYCRSAQLPPRTSLPQRHTALFEMFFRHRRVFKNVLFPVSHHPIETFLSLVDTL